MNDWWCRTNIEATEPFWTLFLSWMHFNDRKDVHHVWLFFSQQNKTLFKHLSCTFFLPSNMYLICRLISSFHTNHHFCLIVWRRRKKLMKLLSLPFLDSSFTSKIPCFQFFQVSCLWLKFQKSWINDTRSGIFFRLEIFFTRSSVLIEHWHRFWLEKKKNKTTEFLQQLWWQLFDRNKCFC